MNEDRLPVCKILDYSKYLYDQKKHIKMREKANRANAVSNKEVRLSSNIADYDMQIKANNASRLLKEGAKVKVNMMFKGRARQFINKGIERLELFDTMVDIEHKVMIKPTIEGNSVTMTLSLK